MQLRDDYHRPTTIHRIQCGGDKDNALIKFYGRIVAVAEEAGVVYRVEDSLASILVNCSNFENVALEPGEFYRFMCKLGVRNGEDIPRLHLFSPPTRVDGYDDSIYELCLRHRNKVERKVESLESIFSA